MRSVCFLLRPSARVLCAALPLASLAVLLLTIASPVAACTNILVTRGASADGSVIITYAADDAGAYATLGITPAADHKPGEMIEIPPRSKTDKRPPGKIPQVPHTYKVLAGLMNEHQLSLSETTFGGRPELVNPQGLLDYPMLMQLGLQRARTAREAIQVMTKLVAEHGYGDEGESISIADPQEAWVLEIVGSGPGGKGGVWVAVRIPDGQISCHANQARIGEFPRDDPANCLYSENVESFAISKGWYDPKSGKPFRFYEAYCPPNPGSKRFCDARVWSILRRAAPTKHFSADYHRGKPGAEPYPFSIVPDAKLSAADVFALMRDHFEGTEFDMTQGVDAGPYGLPRRWRPLTWKVDVSNYANLKYSHMTPEIRACQKDIESNLLALQPAVEKVAVELSKSNPALMTRYLSDYSVMHAEQTVGRWRELGEHLIAKYNDGYVRDPQGKYPDVGYPEAWLRRVIRERPEQFRMPVEKPEAKGGH